MVFDIFSPDSRMRALVRGIKNKWSERSAAKLRIRIVQLELNRAKYNSYLTSDKAQYLTAFSLIFTLLVCIAMGEVVSMVLRLLFGANDSFAFAMKLLLYGAAIAIGFQGVKISSLDTREKVAGAVARLDSEIKGLEAKLDKLMLKSLDH
jgi:hypothetical protein